MTQKAKITATASGVLWLEELLQKPVEESLEPAPDVWKQWGWKVNSKQREGGTKKTLTSKEWRNKQYPTAFCKIVALTSIKS